ncbi:MAG: hypothetical protein QG578_1165 [Thermodesulfobacteriota bacterium]|nr:hypothetical protein [Thermodesulfobacteriota bacterium]
MLSKATINFIITWKIRACFFHVLPILKQYMGTYPLISTVFRFRFAASAYAGNDQLPPEVAAVITDRDICDHFRGEPYEGNSPEQIERRDFIFESHEIYCPGTDRRLAALKKRYRKNTEVMRYLNKYEEKIEEKLEECFGQRIKRNRK